MDASRIPSRRARRHGFTMVEVSVVILTLALLILLLLPRLAGTRRRGHPPSCVNNLKNIGLALRIFATDNEGLFPWQLSAPCGGTKDQLAPPWRVLPHFQALSNELSTPSVLFCPEDKRRQVAPNFASLSDGNLSYFLGLDSQEEAPQSILSGDRNLTLAGVEYMPGLAVLKPSQPLGFSRQIHKRAGNLLFGDGSVESERTPGLLIVALTNAFNTSEQKPIRLLIP